MMVEARGSHMANQGLSPGTGSLKVSQECVYTPRVRGEGTAPLGQEYSATLSLSLSSMYTHPVWSQPVIATELQVVLRQLA